jgi:hypothetical protein
VKTAERKFDMAEEVQKTESEKKWDTERQRADMEHANFLKAKTEKDELAGKITSYEGRIAELEKQIQVNRNKVEIGELDPLKADLPDVVNQNQKLVRELNGLRGALSQLEEKAKQYEQKEFLRVQQEQRSEMINNICSPLDQEFGAKFRSKAIKMAEDAVNGGRETPPKGELQAYHLLKKYYKLAKDEETEEKKKEPIPTDNGSGAFSFTGTEIKEGPLNDVVGQIRKLVTKK